MKIIQVINKTCIYYSNKGKVLRHSTGVDWNDRNTKRGKSLVASVKNKLGDIVDNYVILNGVNPSVDYVKSELRKEQIVNKELLTDYYEEFLQSKKSDIKIKPQSVKDYISLQNALNDYQIDNQKLLLTDISTNFLINFTQYLSQQRIGSVYKTKGGLNDNTIRKRLTSFRTFLHYLIDNKYYIPSPTTMKYNIEKYDTHIVTLTEDELKSLIEWNAGKYEYVRDVFVFGCMTSLRYSDIISLNKSHITNDVIIKKAQKSPKGKEQYQVPLNSISKSILEKYKYRLNRYKSQPFNRLLKDMAEECKLFDYDEEYEIYIGGESQFISKKKHEMISSHTARRTFITRCIIKGIPINQIMLMSSHKKLDTLIKYIDKYSDKSNSYVKQLEV